MYFVIRLCEPYNNTGYTILIHGLILILYYIRMIILCYANVVVTPTLPRVRTKLVQAGQRYRRATPDLCELFLPPCRRTTMHGMVHMLLTVMYAVNVLSATVMEDSSACVAAAKVPYITRKIRHLDLVEHHHKEKRQDGTCSVVEVASAENNADCQ
jgi:hypothetical protein